MRWGCRWAIVICRVAPGECWELTAYIYGYTYLLPCIDSLVIVQRFTTRISNDRTRNIRRSSPRPSSDWLLQQWIMGLIYPVGCLADNLWKHIAMKVPFESIVSMQCRKCSEQPTHEWLSVCVNQEEKTSPTLTDFVDFCCCCCCQRSWRADFVIYLIIRSRTFFIIRAAVANPETETDKAKCWA